MTYGIDELNGWFKDIFANMPIDLTTGQTYVAGAVPFSKGDRVGQQYSVPVILTHNASTTYGVISDDIVNLNDAVAATTKEATLNPTHMIERARTPFHILARSTGSANGDKRAFGDTATLMVKKVSSAIAHKLESSFFYGGTSIATASTSSNVNSTTTDVTVDKAAWAAALWRAGTNQKLDAYETDALSTQVGSAPFTISNVNLSTRVVRLTGASGDISALDTRLGSASASFVFQGAAGKEMSGIDVISSNSGLLHGIDGSVYPTWAGNSVSAAGVLTRDIIEQGVTAAMDRGLEDGEVDLLVNPASFADLNEALATLYQLGNNTLDASVGARKIAFPCGGVVVNVLSSTYIKRGVAYMGPFSKRMKRIGSSELEFGIPGIGGDKYLTYVNGTNAAELTAFTEQSLFCEHPGAFVKFTGIVDSAA